MTRRYLQHIYVERYGGLADRAIGPFGPGLNVVYGPNEAGKSTVSSLVGGVLFGWEEAHGVRNTYRPPAGDRAGRLEWAPAPCVAGGQSPGDTWPSGATSGTRYREGSPAGGSATVTALRRDEQGATGDVSVTGDIDRGTFATLFSLTADELRSLRGSSDVAARLLSAGSGTGTSPSAAFVTVEQRIVSATADILQLDQQVDQKREQVKRASERTELLLQEDRELRELAVSRTATAARIDELNSGIEDLVAWRAELESVDVRTAAREDELAALRAELEEAAGPSPDAPTIDARLLGLDSAADRVLRDRLDEFAEERGKLDRVADAAKENSATSTAAYEALMELSDEDIAAARSLRNRTSQAVVSVLLPVAFIAAGIPLFIHGREIASLSFTALGAGLVLIAAFLAAAAFFVLFRPPRVEGALDARRQDAQWVMLQDRKKLDASMREREAFDARLAAFLEDVGLSAANGSIRQARTLLDEAAARRAELAAADQKASSLELRIRAAEKELAECASIRSRIAQAAGLATWQDASAVPSPEDSRALQPEHPFARHSGESGEQLQGDRPSSVPGTDGTWYRTVATGAAPAPVAARELDALVRERSAQRDALLEAAEDMSQRFGELTRELAAARDDRTFDQLKLEYHELRTRLRERKHELMELLLAKRMLERSIVSWESQSQPEVYAQAGRLLATITGGRWVEVATSPTGSLVAVAADGTARDPRHLSLGTCQQLYLALRIALLMVADDVGANVPVLADDILVNFDAARRAGAARALAELARARQVILFTCHEEVAALFPDAPRIDLQTAPLNV